jgi:hypothetical protein
MELTKDLVTEIMGSVAFVLIAGFAGLCLAVPLAHLFVGEITTTNFWPYAVIGFVAGAPLGLIGYRLRERYLDETIEI